MNLRKTGTTIVGLKYKDGVALFSDTRSTIGDMVEDSNVQKLHRISESIYCAGCGLSADADRITRTAEQRQTLFERKFKRKSFVGSVRQFMTNHLFTHRGGLQASFILGGVDESGFHLYDIHSYGSSSSVDYVALGSGSLAAYSVLEGNYKSGLSEEKVVELGVKAIETGILNDLYSGSRIDCVLMTKEKTEFKRSIKVVCEKEKKPRIVFPASSVFITKEEVFKYVKEV